MENQVNLYQPLALFVPESAGDSNALLMLTLQAVGQTFPLLNHLLGVVGRTKLSPVRIEQLFTDAEGKAAADVLKLLFTKFGSDKSTGHNYHHLYGEILKDKDDISHVLEIGLGTNNLDVVSNMGTRGMPGASLRAFREYLPNATIFGADIDKRILFQEDRIQTYFVDQTDLTSLESLGKNIPDFMDLIIDDGLHSPNANLAVLAFGLKKLKNHGWLVIEDIPERAVPLWEVVAALLPDTFASRLLRDEGGLVFAVQRQEAPADPYKEGMAAAYGNERVYQTRGDVAQAEASLLVHLELYEALGRKEDVAAAYGYLGIVYQTHGDLAQAEAMYKKALELYEALGRKEGMATAYGYVGIVYQTRGDLAQAEAMQKKALELNEALGRKEGMAAAYGNLGLVYQTRGDLAQAAAMHKKALELNEALGRKEGMAAAYGNLGRVYRTRGDLVQAEAMYKKSIALFQKLGATPQVQQVQASLDQLAVARATSAAGK
jgi:tetratricopeptide (TPR) repeat protein